ncbi:flavodoxin I [Streptohalobacillus salinus]|uniref:Flavodoxin I n=1 Tax=Streptohalobacillus salinus TaxID=621096 RepID=A0A2V3W3V8_9BACI|nr:flavodoxin domain-containing protein [Streptohalobacillus salinus]PXW88977.1 flavodoxin I [Streptohalobacillus salinus]
MKACIVYTSTTGNTEEVATAIYNQLVSHIDTDLMSIDNFEFSTINMYDYFIIGTYTWGNGQLPTEMKALYQRIETHANKHLRTAVFGTGDRFYPLFCGAVDRFRDMLYEKTDLAVTFKVELSPQQTDYNKVPIFVDRMLAVQVS